MNVTNYVSTSTSESPLVLGMPHSATHVPAGVRHNLDLNADHVRDVTWASADITVPLFTEFASYKNANKVWTSIPRIVLDVNRTLSQVDDLAVEGATGKRDACGLIWRTTPEKAIADFRPILTRPYTQAEFATLLTQAYKPYEKAMHHAMNTAVAKNGYAVHIDLHSMPPASASYVPVEHEFGGAYIIALRERGLLADGKIPDIAIVRKPTHIGPVYDELESLIIDAFTQQGLLVERVPMRPDTVYKNEEYMGQNKFSIGIEIVEHGNAITDAQGKVTKKPRGEYDFSRAPAYQKGFRTLFDAVTSGALVSKLG